MSHVFDRFVNHNRDCIDEIGRLATQPTDLKFVDLLMEFFNPTEIVLILRARRDAEKPGAAP